MINMTTREIKREFDDLYDHIIDKFHSSYDKEARTEAVKATSEILKAKIIADMIGKIKSL